MPVVAMRMIDGGNSSVTFPGPTGEKLRFQRGETRHVDEATAAYLLAQEWHGLGGKREPLFEIPGIDSQAGAQAQLAQTSVLGLELLKIVKGLRDGKPVTDDDVAKIEAAIPGRDISEPEKFLMIHGDGKTFGCGQRVRVSQVDEICPHCHTALRQLPDEVAIEELALAVGVTQPLHCRIEGCDFVTPEGKDPAMSLGHHMRRTHPGATG